ncbi:uncharacterized protein EI90DRAFT_3013383 [Cantharellus anzutake]|uniref:uncharacterized protein n=1 Tax=Cantharellus anzutake TaxID=1750568 RepID=UPI0019074C72|nr:uncharacterized protein EI90DRAFT_3013383 [Cantharellus anzutake]KAF8338059.1 hypothetical protein EI90DRAFT_3013383 [Cantharellus anzutake]
MAPTTRTQQRKGAIQLRSGKVQQRDGSGARYKGVSSQAPPQKRTIRRKALFRDPSLDRDEISDKERDEDEPNDEVEYSGDSEDGGDGKDEDGEDGEDDDGDDREAEEAVDRPEDEDEGSHPPPRQSPRKKSIIVGRSKSARGLVDDNPAAACIGNPIGAQLPVVQVVKGPKWLWLPYSVTHLWDPKRLLNDSPITHVFDIKAIFKHPGITISSYKELIFSNFKIGKDKPSAFHNTIKTFSRECITKEYGFSPVPCDANVNLANCLLDATNFYFQEWEDPGGRRGRYRSQCFQNVIGHLYRDADWELSWEGFTEDQHNELLPQLIWFAATAVSGNDSKYHQEITT